MSTNSETDILPDLKKLLRETINDQVSIVSYQTSSLLPAGENFASVMLKVEVKIKRTANAPEEKLQLVAKMVPTAEFTKNALKVDVSFGKEIFVFEKLAAFYRQIEKDTKLGEEKNLKDLFPKFYGGQLTRNEENPGEADDHAILLLENVKVLGYDTMDRKNGLDLEHAKVATTELARYHALGIALKTHKPAVFEESRKYMEFPFEMSEDEFQEIVDHTMKLISQDPRICNYVDRIKSTFVNLQTFLEYEAIEPWVSINHGDFWINNIMFCHGKNGIQGVKFIDFQLTRICSPIYDIPYFLCGSTSPDVLDKHFDDLLDIYYKRFIEVLKKTNCDSSLFTKASFEENLKRIARKMTVQVIIAIKFFTLEVSDGSDVSDVKSSVMLSGGSKLFLDRVWNIVKKYLDKGWL